MTRRKQVNKRIGLYTYKKMYVLGVVELLNDLKPVRKWWKCAYSLCRKKRGKVQGYATALAAFCEPVDNMEMGLDKSVDTRLRGVNNLGPGVYPMTHRQRLPMSSGNTVSVVRTPPFDIQAFKQSNEVQEPRCGGRVTGSSLINFFSVPAHSVLVSPISANGRQDASWRIPRFSFGSSCHSKR